MTIDNDRAEQQAMELVDRLNARHRAFNNLIAVADKVCAKMEHPTASVTILDQDELRKAITEAQAH